MNLPRVLTGFLILFMTMLAVRGESGFAPATVYIKQTKTIHFQNESHQGFKISGWTRYPNKTKLYIKLSYRSRQLARKSASVEQGKFEAEIRIKEKLLASYYDIEVAFYPKRQPASLRKKLQSLPPETIFDSVRVGTPQKITKERTKNIDFLKEVLGDGKYFYDGLRRNYLKIKAGEDYQFNLRSWKKAHKSMIKDLKQHEKILLAQQENYLTPFFPELTFLALDFIYQTYRIYEQVTKDLRRGGTVDVHTGKKIKTESVVAQIDSAFNFYYPSLQADIQFKEQIGDENIILDHFRQLEKCYRDLTAGYQKGLARNITPETWEVFSQSWPEKETKLKNQLTSLQSSNSAPQLNDFYQDLGNLTDSLARLHRLYTRHITHQSPDEKRLEENIASAQNTFAGDFYRFLTWLRFPRLLIGKLSPPDENTVSPEKRSPEETKKLIERQIQLLKESTDKIRRTMNLRRLLSIGPSVIPYLKQELAQADDSTTTIFLRAICSFKDEIPALKPTLLKLLKSDDLKLKRQVVATLKYINDSTVIEALINLATDKNPSIRGEAISSLGYLKRPESIETIILALADNEKEVREKSIGALWEITQTSFKFTPHASESIRKQEIKVIQRWWDANKKKYLQ